MAQPERVFKQSFASDFTGINGECSSIEQDAGEVNRAVNLEYAVGNSLRGRVGCQISGAHGFFGIFPYSYTRTQDQYAITYQAPTGGYPTQTGSITTTKTAADGASINKLIGINQQMWVLDTLTVSVSRISGTYPFTWYATVSGSDINFVIKANGSSILNTSLGDGINSSVSIYSLLTTINALPELSLSIGTRGACPPFAVINGNQNAAFVATLQYGTSRSITVDAGHTFFPGDVICLGGNPLKAGIVINTTGTVITYVGPAAAFLDNDIVGYLGQPASSFPISTVQTASSGALNMSFPYWRLIPDGDGTFGEMFLGEYVLASAGVASRNFYAPPVSAQGDDCLYVAGSSAYTDNSYLKKTDGLTTVRAGLPDPVDITITAPGAGALTGTYKYKFYLKRVDAQGNIIEGPVSAVTSIVHAANYSGVTLRYKGFGDYGFPAWQGRSCYKYTAEAPASGSFFYVDDGLGAPGGMAFIQPGDPVCLLNNTAAKVGLWHFAFGVDPLGQLQRTVCTDVDGNAYPPLSIKVANSSGYTIPDNSEISTGLTAVVLRTSAGGNQYYVLCEVPITGYGAFPSFTFFDNVTDAVLTAGEQYTEVQLGKEHNAPPPCSLVCSHQGGLVVARGFGSPNTVAFSTADGIEYFPTASNSFDIPSTQSGYITAIASDTNDRLAVFKDRAYYDVVGDLDGGIFSINVRNEGDYGVSSQASLIRAKDTLIGVCKNGFIIVANGQLDGRAYKAINARLINQNYYFNWAVAANDSYGRKYICSIPTTGEPVTLIVDYSRDATVTFENSYTTKIDPAGGMAVVGSDFYHLSATSPYGVFRRLERFDGNSPGSGDGDSFIDNTNAITYILESQPINFGEPALLKTPLRIRLWSLPNDYVKEGWVPFSTLIETGASALASYVGGSNPNASSTSVTFSAETDAFKDVALKSCKTNFYIIRLTTNTIRTSPFWTGYEVIFSDNYTKEDLVR